jgi:hypothetical protein
MEDFDKQQRWMASKDLWAGRGLVLVGLLGVLLGGYSLSQEEFLNYENWDEFALITLSIFALLYGRGAASSGYNFLRGIPQKRQ